MNQIRLFLAQYGSILLPAGEIVLFLLLLTAIHQIRKVRKELKRICQQVESYVNTVLEETTEELPVLSQDIQENQMILSKQAESAADKMETAQMPREQESPETLIHAVLQEIFP